MKSYIILFLFLIFQTALLNAQHFSRADSLKVELEQADDIAKIDILNQLSDLYRRSDPFTSYRYDRDALNLSTLNNHTKGQILALSNIGVFFQYNAQYSKALENYFKVNELIYGMGGDSSLLIGNNNLLGEVYRDLKEFDKALEYYETALELAKNTGAFGTEIVIHANIALTYIDQRKFDEALTISEESLRNSESRDYQFGIMISLYNIGLVNHHLEKYEKAIENFQILENLVEQYGEQMGAEFIQGKIKLFHSFAESHYSLNQFKPALEYALKAWELASTTIYKIDFKNVNDFLYSYYLGRGNHKEALRYLELSYKLNDELKSETNNRQVLLLESLEEERKETIERNLEQQKRERKFRLEYIGISVIILIVFLLATIFGRYKMSKQIGKAILFLSFLFLFEFVLLLVDPPLELYTSGQPAYKMLANSGLAIAFTFLHRFLERKVTLNRNGYPSGT